MARLESSALTTFSSAGTELRNVAWSACCSFTCSSTSETKKMMEGARLGSSAWRLRAVTLSVSSSVRGGRSDERSGIWVKDDPILLGDIFTFVT